MTGQNPGKATAYDRYINYRTFAVAVAVFVALLAIPVPESMRDVAVEYSVGEDRVRQFFAEELFEQAFEDVEQWKAFTACALEGCMLQGVVSKDGVLKRNAKRLEAMGLHSGNSHYEAYRRFVEGMDASALGKLMVKARSLRYDELSYAGLTPAEREEVDVLAGRIRICVAMVGFVVVCFLTEAIPLPGVAFCIGLILVFSGIVSRREIAALYWSDACWFIMGSLMFAVALVKTGVDKRICLILFRTLARPSVGWITAVMIAVIAPAAAFISDHALAAIFLPIALILYHNSLGRRGGEDLELARMLMITIAMACNIGGFGSPSGGARNVIMMTYMEDMFGITMGYGQWMMFGMPFVLIMIPLLWLVINWRFKPRIRDLRPALDSLKQDIDRMGGWNRQQIVALGIFLLMFLGWITESGPLLALTGVRLGIGVIAVAGAMAYLLTGVVNWRDYQTKVDWGVIWLYAGAIVFGHVLDKSGTACWLARSIVGALSGIGLDSGPALLAAGSTVTAGMTNLMADGPAAAAVGPITLNMAAVASPGTTLIPFMGLATACSSSFAYLLVIGTPPNAIVYSSGYLGARDFLRVGFLTLVMAFAVLMLLCIVVWPLIGFAGLGAC